MIYRWLRCIASTMASGYCLLGTALAADSNQDIQGQLAMARPSSMYTEAGTPERLEFSFGEIRVWLKDSGTWHIEGPVSHQGLLCATRQLGVRFGVGQPACTNMRWLSEFEFTDGQKQCNSATTWHTGGGELPALKSEFGRINCAERVIQCSGNCK